MEVGAFKMLIDTNNGKKLLALLSVVARMQIRAFKMLTDKHTGKILLGKPKGG